MQRFARDLRAAAEQAEMPGEQTDAVPTAAADLTWEMHEKQFLDGETAVFLLSGKPVSVPVTEDITIYHKFAIRDIAEGEPVVKYGEHIGQATAFIPAGAHVHVHNVVSMKEDRRGKE